MSDSAYPLRFHSDGHFRILMVSDFHGGTNHNPKLTKALEALIAHAAPDLVLIGGDTVAGCAILMRRYSSVSNGLEGMHFLLRKRKRSTYLLFCVTDFPWMKSMAH